MRVIVDLNHPAHINFFKTFIRHHQANHDICLSYLDRGRVKDIVASEFPELESNRAGRHTGSKLSIIFEANILKFFKLLYLIYTSKAEVGLSCGSFTLGMAMKLLGRPNLQFDDDPERKANLALEKFTATKLMIPFFYEDIAIEKFNSLKEWAYLSPKYFSPRIEVLHKYHLEEKKYLFIREVSNKTFNYMKQSCNPIASFAATIGTELPIIMSLEDKSSAHLYPTSWIIIEEPEPNIHSLMYFSLALVSSGDSMAREGSMLGVPSIYCGSREMAANKVLIDLGMLRKIEPNGVSGIIQDIEYGRLVYPIQEDFRNYLLHEWDDVNDVILNFIESEAKR